DRTVTGVQTCALPIWVARGVLGCPEGLPEAEAAEVGVEAGVIRVTEESHRLGFGSSEVDRAEGPDAFAQAELSAARFPHLLVDRSEERRVGKECRARW